MADAEHEGLERMTRELNVALEAGCESVARPPEAGEELVQRVAALLAKTERLEFMAKAKDEANLVYAERNAELAARVSRMTEAIKIIKEAVAGDKNPRWSDDYATTRTRGHIADICDVALMSPKP